MQLRAGKRIVAEELCGANRVSASHEAGCRSIDWTAPNKVAEAYPNSGKSVQKNATAAYNRDLYTWMLLVGLSIFQIGCREQSKNRFSFPEHPTPLPAPSDQIDIGAAHPESGQLLKRSDKRE